MNKSGPSFDRFNLEVLSDYVQIPDVLIDQLCQANSTVFSTNASLSKTNL